MKYDVLYIGGCADGVRVTLDELLPYRRMARRSDPCIMSHGFLDMAPSFKEEFCYFDEYQLRFFSPDRPLYILVGMSYDKVLNRLFDNYRPENENRH
jgi:hypothetical protein